MVGAWCCKSGRDHCSTGQQGICVNAVTASCHASTVPLNQASSLWVYLQFIAVNNGLYAVKESGGQPGLRNIPLVLPLLHRCPQLLPLLPAIRSWLMIRVCNPQSHGWLSPRHTPGVLPFVHRCPQLLPLLPAIKSWFVIKVCNTKSHG